MVIWLNRRESTVHATSFKRTSTLSTVLLYSAQAQDLSVMARPQGSPARLTPGRHEIKL
jgi:hypothetical protein